MQTSAAAVAAAVSATAAVELTHLTIRCDALTKTDICEATAAAMMQRVLTHRASKWDVCRRSSDAECCEKRSVRRNKREVGER